MRIIRLLVALAILSLTLVPQITLAASALEGTDSNETKINFKIDSNFIIEGGVIRDRYDFLAMAPKNFEGYTLSKVKTEEELRREKVLARYEEKRKKANYPQGKFTVNASAYTAAADECGKSDGITASGLKVKENLTIACPPQFPLGTKLRIDEMGTYVCEDRGGAIKVIT